MATQTPDLIFCYNNAINLTKIALNYGFLYGHRTTQDPLHNIAPHFLDLDHRTPDRDFPRHLALTAQHHPKYSIAGDATTPQELTIALARAAQLHAASPGTNLIIVPKTTDLINALLSEAPHYIVGYSVPTEFGASLAQPAAYAGCARVHLLGGSPATQLRLAHLLNNVVSVDTNAHVKAAQVGTYWDFHSSKWKRMPLNTRKVTQDALIPAFALSCKSIQQAWKVWSH